MMKDLLSKVTGKLENLPRFEIDGKKVLSVGFPELDALHVYGYMIGEGRAMFGQSRGPLYIVNTGTNKIKKLVDENSKVVGFTKEDIDYKSLDGIEHTGDAYRMEVDYAGMGRYSDFRDGICAFTGCYILMECISQMKMASEWKIMTKLKYTA